MKTSRDNKMADDQDDFLFQKVHNFILPSGGFVDRIISSFQVSSIAGEQKICAGIEEVAEESD